ncbi:MAG: 50S ribosomal protein L25 [Endomicrobium sp.]|jgi:large subunit ribosomal protein L25|nr:50S ribosomal protein L25 [Endomicrobium sp.]
MKEALLSVENREVSSKGVLANLRRGGKVPAVFYGKGIDSKTIAVDSKTFVEIIESGGLNSVITLDFKDGKKPSIVKTLQRDIISQEPIHIDFQSISLQDTVEVLVPIRIEGIADGVKNFGALMESILREVKVKCLPTNIPKSIAIDVSPLGIGQGIRIEDLPKLDGVEYLQEPSTLIVHIVAVKEEEAAPVDAAAVAGTEPAQPEVISKGKKDKEGEEGAAAPAAGQAGAPKAAPAKK